MRPRTPGCQIWVKAALCLAVLALGASEPESHANALSDYVVERVATVPQVTIRAIAQTQDGYLWLGTYKGLIRWDGVRAITFDVANTAGLSSDAVYALHEDRAGNLWIGTDDGGVIRHRGGDFRSFGEAEGLTESEVRAICEDREGKLWVGTRRGLFYQTNDSFALFQTTNLLANPKVTALAAAPDGSLWIGTSTALFRLKNGNTERLPKPAEGYVQGLAIDAHEVLWVTLDSTKNLHILTDSGGVQVENSSGPFFYHWYQPGRGGTFLLADFNGRLCRLDGLTNAVLITRFEQRNLMSLREDLNGNIWVGLESHGLYRVRRKQVRTISTPDGLPIDDVTTILADQGSRMWLGTFGKGLYASADRMDTFLPVDIPGVANVTALFERADGMLSLGTYHGDHYRGDGTNS